MGCPLLQRNLREAFDTGSELQFAVSRVEVGGRQQRRLSKAQFLSHEHADGRAKHYILDVPLAGHPIKLHIKPRREYARRARLLKQTHASFQRLPSTFGPMHSRRDDVFITEFASAFAYPRRKINWIGHDQYGPGAKPPLVALATV